MTNIINVRDFSAVGDGKTDDTEAIRRAASELPQQCGVLFFPAGHYLSDTIEVKKHTTYTGPSSWQYYNAEQASGVTISPVHNDQDCLFKVSNGGSGVRFKGLCLRGTVGNYAQGEEHPDRGVDLPWNEALEASGGKSMDGIIAEGGCDQLNIDDCKIERFTGNGFTPRGNVWAMRHSLMMFNGGHGIDTSGCADAWVIDTQMSGNRGAGLLAFASLTVTGNRIEHNVEAGVIIQDSYAASIELTGNLLCCNEGPAIVHEKGRAEGITITGNTIRHALHVPKSQDPERSCLVRLRDMHGLCFVGNSLYTYPTNNPEAPRKRSADVQTGMILGGLVDSVVANNTLFNAATRELIRDEGGHENSIIKDNPGRLTPDR